MAATVGVYLIQDSGNLVAMTEQAYDSEDLLQKLLATSPALLAGDQMDSTAPRRWLLISREMTVPDDESGDARWSLDHLFLAQDAIPTLVEVKRSSDTRLRREVVGQMLDYAANAVVYWPVEVVRARFNARCELEKREPNAVLQDALAIGEEGAEDFWQKVKTNLQAGRVRLVFVADVIPTELRRVVEFLNSQMDPAEVLAVEIRQYVGQGLKTLVPRVFGQTAEALVKKGAGLPARTWDRSTFLEEARRQLPAAQAAAVEHVLQASDETAQDMGWGRGRTGSFSPKFSGASAKSFFTVRVNGDLQLNRKWHEQEDAGNMAPRFRDEFLDRLRSRGLAVPDGFYPSLPAATWTDKADVLVRAIHEVFGAGRDDRSKR